MSIQKTTAVTKKTTDISFYKNSSFDLKPVIFRKIVNSFLNFPFLWRLVIRSKDFDIVLNPGSGKFSFLTKLLQKTIWFWPRTIDASVWMNERIDPAPFRVLTPDAAYLVDHVVARASNKQSPILDLGCSCGRHLAALSEKGFSNLHGVDINSQAISVLPEWFPTLKNNCNAKADLFQSYLPAQEDGKFDIVFTRGATIEYVHPSFPIVKEMCRVTRSHVILMIGENRHKYTRFWTWEFMRNGFILSNLVRPASQMLEWEDSKVGSNVSLLVFSRRERL